MVNLPPQEVAALAGQVAGACIRKDLLLTSMLTVMAAGVVGVVFRTASGMPGAVVDGVLMCGVAVEGVVGVVMVALAVAAGPAVAAAPEAGAAAMAAAY